MITYNEYIYDIDFNHFNNLDNDDKYEYLDSIISCDGRLQSRLIAESKLTLGNILFAIYHNWEDYELDFWLHKFAIKLSLLEKYITKHFDENYLDGNPEKLNIYEDKICRLEKQIFDILPEEYPVDIDDEELVNRHFEEYMLNANN
tara:strand:+ start:45 stop:482 length:438 start_codon:yes stop_codon:yes gene_type:complete